MSINNVVADHYNKVSTSVAATLEERESSRIVNLRKFNNFCKTMLINKSISMLRESKSEISVLDLCCGRGGDLIKWKKSGVNKLVGVDISEDSINECYKRSLEINVDNNMESNFFVADCTRDNLWKYVKHIKSVDLTSCQFALHYSFESYESAMTMLYNACSRINDNGLFIGIIPNSFEILRDLIYNGNRKISNSIMSIDLENVNDKLFGSSYNFKLDDLVDCPEYLIYFPFLKKILRELNFECIYFEPLSHFFLSHKSKYTTLYDQIKPLKQFTRAELKSLYYDYMLNDLNYSHITDRLRRGVISITTFVQSLSLEEWDVVNLYSVFIFKKQPILRNPALDSKYLTNSSSNQPPKDTS